MFGIWSQRIIKMKSLKRTLIIGILLSTVVPILLIGAVSYYMIYVVLDNKAANSVISTLHQVTSSVEKTYSNLSYVSQQLTNNQLQLLVHATDPVERYLLDQQVLEHLNSVSFTNPDLGLFQIYLPKVNERYYENQVMREITEEEEPYLLSDYKGLTIYAPHQSYTFDQKLVFSLSRPVNMLKQSQINIYVESHVDTYQQLLNSEQYGMDVKHVMTNSNREVVFSEDELLFPIGKSMPKLADDSIYQVVGNYYYFHESSKEQDWHMYAIVAKSHFQTEMKKWTLSWLLIAMISLLLSVTIGWSIWRIFYLPIRKLNFEMRQLGESRFDNETLIQRGISLTHIIEIDGLLKQFEEMRSKIWLLLNELKENEEEKRHLEVDKLIAQINPHFLYNTLNTIQWLARSKGQEDIVQLVTVFIRLMRYNLGKDGGNVPLSKEVEVLQDYITLQQIRYNHEFIVDMHLDPQTLNMTVPRFLLQPLIENALYHGQTDEGSSITLTISLASNQDVLVKVEDRGKGMSEEQIQRLLHYDIPEKEKVGIGIGLNYVNTMLRVHFGDEVKLQAVSSEQGTTMSFRLPAYREEKMKEGIKDD